MESIPPKIIAAISTAVKSYREDQKLLEAKEAIRPTLLQADRASLWAIAGRQDAMFQRRLWQMRMY